MPDHVVLFSGGLDSTVTLGLACWHGGTRNVIAVGISYGQAHINELGFARRTAERADVRYFQMMVDPSPWKLLPLLTGATQLDRDVFTMRTGGVSDAFVPGRNVVFLAAALAVAGIQNARHIWIGANADDSAGFPDCRPPFFYAWQQMASHALQRTIHLQAPLLNHTKRQIVQLARDMAIDLDATWSCYRPQHARSGVIACGRCDACRLREDATGSDPVR
jgi:7-cyano-7-deazaguanine synthase